MCYTCEQMLMSNPLRMEIHSGVLVAKKHTACYLCIYINC